MKDPEGIWQIMESLSKELITDRAPLPCRRALWVIGQSQDQTAQFRVILADPPLTGLFAALELSARGRTRRARLWACNLAPIPA